MLRTYGRLKRLYYIGINFDQATKSIASWAHEMVNSEELIK